MKRRRYLAGLCVSATAGLAGCTGGGRSGRDGGSAEDSDSDGDRTARSATVSGPDGTPAGICNRKPRPGVIPAIVDPAFAPDYSEISEGAVLADSTPVIGIERDGQSRAYPLSILARNEIVNDTFDVPVVVTYCPLCASGLTGVREVDGTTTVFENTSHTWEPPDDVGRQALDEERVFGVSHRSDKAEARNNQNLVMYDVETESYWSQLLARAICGPLTGERLTLVPSTVTRWGEWQGSHSETTVLLPPPRSKT